MKIYTQNQVKILLDKMSLVTERKNLGVSANFRHRAIEIDNLLKDITTIELPTDEDIDEISCMQYPKNLYFISSREKYDEFAKQRLGFIEGLKYLKNKIERYNK